MSKREIDRLDILNRLLRKEMNGTQAAALLSLTVRHIRRLKQKVKKKEAHSIIHGNRGKPSNRSVPKKERETIKELLHTKYADFGPTLASEKLSELHGITRDPKTIRSLQIAEKLWTPRKGKKQSEHRDWRARKEAYGEMLQYDGSYHDWLEGRGETNEQCLLAAIDDATGRVTKAAFAAHEGVIPTFAFWKEYTLCHGKPRCIYLDKFSTYKVNHKIAAENPDVKTQFQRACDELGIQPIFANSPQAKGRVERLFQTFQDRLIKEMRLATISNIQEANIFLKEVFLPRFNERFSVEAVSLANLHKSLTHDEKKNLDSTFSRHTQRTVQNDFTLAFETTWYQLTKYQAVTIRKKEKVIVEEHLDGTMHICLRGKELNYEMLPARPKNTKDVPWVLAAGTRPQVTSRQWRTSPYGKRHLIQSAK